MGTAKFFLQAIVRDSGVVVCEKRSRKKCRVQTCLSTHGQQGIREVAPNHAEFMRAEFPRNNAWSQPKDSTFLAEDGDHPDLCFPNYRQVKIRALESVAT